MIIPNGEEKQTSLGPRTRQSPDPSAISHSSLKYDGKEMQNGFLSKELERLLVSVEGGGSGRFGLLSLYFMLFSKG